MQLRKLKKFQKVAVFGHFWANFGYVSQISVVGMSLRKILFKKSYRQFEKFEIFIER